MTGTGEMAPMDLLSPGLEINVRLSGLGEKVRFSVSMMRWIRSAVARLGFRMQVRVRFPLHPSSFASFCQFAPAPAALGGVWSVVRIHQPKENPPTYTTEAVLATLEDRRPEWRPLVLPVAGQQRIA
jgi:hypothetical protein